MVFIGRYFCFNSENMKSQAGYNSAISLTMAKARSALTTIDSTLCLFDYPLLLTIQLLYLVEFANWDSQRMIGFGGGNRETLDAPLNGRTDSMPYHTGTTTSNRTTKSFVQYRNIENLWSCFRFPLDNCLWSAYNGNFSIRLNKAHEFVEVGTLPLLDTYPQKISVSIAEGYKWFFYPNGTGGSNSTYIPDLLRLSAPSSNKYSFDILLTGSVSNDYSSGLFSLDKSNISSEASYTGYISFRLQELP